MKKLLGWFMIVAGVITPIVMIIASFSESNVGDSLEMGLIVRAFVVAVIAIPIGVKFIRGKKTEAERKEENDTSADTNTRPATEEKARPSS